MYLSLFKSHNNNEISRKCNFIDGYIYFKLPGKLNKTNNSYIIEFGSLNNNNFFKAKYLLEFNSKNEFSYCLELSNQLGGFSTYVNSIQFTNNIEQLYDIDKNKPIGLIYNLDFSSKQKINQPEEPPLNINQRLSIENNKNNNILNEFKTPSLIGLINFGGDDYMNATLQCLSQIGKLTNYFKYKQYVDQIISQYDNNNQLCLTKSFKIIVENLWPSKSNKYLENQNTGKNINNKYFIPNDFKNKISSMYPLFKNPNANDPKDLLEFIINTLHKELNKSQNNNNNDNNAQQFQNFILDQSNQELMFKNFFEKFQNENKSKITDLFYGVNHTLKKCWSCNNIKHKFDSFFFLIFPLEDVKNFAVQNITMNMNMSIKMMMNNINQMQINMKCQSLFMNIIDIKDCFDYYRRTINYIGNNAIYCERCNNQMNSTCSTVLFTPPEILIIILDRGIGQQLKIKLQFQEILDIRNYIEASQSIGGLYELIGVITLLGESFSNGHLIASCKSPIDHKWYQYDDAMVKYLNDFNSQILNTTSPYILFYQKKA